MPSGGSGPVDTRQTISLRVPVIRSLRYGLRACGHATSAADFKAMAAHQRGVVAVVAFEFGVSSSRRALFGRELGVTGREGLRRTVGGLYHGALWGKCSIRALLSVVRPGGHETTTPAVVHDKP